MTGNLIFTIILLFSAFEYNGGEPASLFPFPVAAEDCALPGIYLNPLTITSGKGLTFSTYGSRPYSESELHSYTSGIKYSTGDYGTQFSWHSFGTDFYSENRFTAGAGIFLWNKFHAGGSLSAYKLDIEADEESFSKTVYDGDIATAFTPCKWLSLSLMQSSVIIASGKNSTILYPDRSAGILLKPSPGFSITWNITNTSAGNINTFTANVTPSEFFALRGGYTPEDSRFSASLTVFLKNMSFAYALSSHPYLGYTHSLGITYAANPEAETIRYTAMPLSRPEKRININSGTPDEIRNIPGLSTRSSDRIILYREKAGPVSEKSLKQMGLDKSEIDSVKLYCYGLARESSGNNQDEKFSESKRGKTKKKKFIPRKIRIRNKFREMIKIGIPAGTAIRYSELSESSESSGIESILAEDKSLTGKEKDAVLRICAE